MSTAERALEKYDGNFNVLLPAQVVQQVSPWHAARTSIVKIDPDPNSGDVFKVGSRYNSFKEKYEDLFTLGKPALMRIAAAAGIVWNWRESGPMTVTRDYVAYKAVGAIRLPDGSWQPIIATKEIDLTVIEEEQYEANLKKAKEYAADPEKQGYLKGLTPEQWARAQTKTAMIQWRKNKLMRAETGAMLRVIRAALGMKSQYTREELKKPFVVPRIDFSPDYSDPEVRKALVEHGSQALSALFGHSAPALTPGHTAFEHPAIQAPEAPDASEAAEAFEVGDMEEAMPEVEEEEAELAEGPEEEPEPEPEPEPETPPEPKPAPKRSTPKNAPTCEGCGAAVTNRKVLEYAKQKYNKVLCWDCQQAMKKGGARRG